jgi:hypothetical protein
MWKNKKPRGKVLGKVWLIEYVHNLDRVALARNRAEPVSDSF